MLAKMRTTLVGSIFARAVALGLAYWLTVVLAIELVSPVEKIALFWPPNAIAAAALIFSSRKHWPLYLIAMALAFFAARVPAGHLPLYVYFGFCAANVIEVLIVAGMVKRFIRAPITHETLTKVLLVAMLASIPASFVSALISGVIVTSAIESATFWSASIGWLTGDLSGLLLVLPVLLTWLTPGEPLVKSYNKGEFIERAVVAAVFVAIGLLTPVYLAKESQISLIFPYLVFPILIWTAMRLGIRSTAAAILTVGLFAIALTYLGQGPFNIEGLSAFGQVVLMKVGLITIALTTIFLAIVVTERKLAEGALRESEKQFKGMIEHAGVGVAKTTPDGRFLLVNDRFVDIVGHDREALLSLSFGDITHPEDIDNNLRAIKDLLAGRSQNYITEKRYLRADGGTVWANLTGVVVRNDDETPDYLLAVIEDITKRKQVEEEIRELNEHLEHRVEERTAELRAVQDALLRQERLAALGQLTGTVAHEIRNPLGAIASSIHVIKHRCSEAGLDLQTTLDRTDRSIRRCDRIITELLDFARARGIQPEPTALDTWLSEVLKEQHMPEGISVKTNLQTDGVAVRFDPEELRRAVINVIDNACQVMADGTGEKGATAGGELTVASRLNGERVEIEIMDTGPGIPEDILPQVLEPLFSTKSFGTGLGLPTVQRIMEEHGGGLEISSEEGRGTQVVLWLPPCGESEENQRR